MRALILVAMLQAAPEVEKPSTCAFTGKVVLTSEEGKPLEPGHVVVYVDGPKVTSQEPKTHQITQKGREFVPMVKVVRAGDFIEFINEDKFAHDVYSAAAINTFYSLSSSRSVTGKRKFKITGQVPIRCGIHKFMRSEVLVLDNDWYDSNVQGDGTFTIKDVPATAKVTLTVWEPNGNKASVEVKGCKGQTKVPPIQLQAGPLPKDIDLGKVY